MSAVKFLAELRKLHASTRTELDEALAAGVPVEGVTIGIQVDFDRLGEFLDAVDVVHARAHDLGNRCCANELTLAALVEWAGPAGDSLAWMPELAEIVADARTCLRRKPVGEQAGGVVDPPGTAPTNAAVDGGGEVADLASAPPGSREELAAICTANAELGLRTIDLQDLVIEARDLAKHLLDQGECPECHGGECVTCKGFGFIDDGIVVDVPECGVCKGEGGAPHLEGCRLSTFPARATKALE